MRLLAAHSEVITDGQGWVWLQPRQASLRLRLTLVSLLLTVVLFAIVAATTLAPSVLAVPAVALLAACGLALVVRTVRECHTRVAVCDLGVFVSEGAGSRQIGWAALDGVRAEPARGRVRIAVAAGVDSRTTRAAFDREPARTWLVAATATARRRRLAPVAAPDGLGFTAR